MLNTEKQTTKKDKILFSAGSFALALAVLSITIAPFVVNYFMLTAYVPVLNFQIISGIFYAIALVCYFFSSEHAQQQTNWILITFLYYVVFQVLAKMMS